MKKLLLIIAIVIIIFLTTLINNNRITKMDNLKSDNVYFINLNESLTIDDLKITNTGGGHEMVDSGEDPSYVNLQLETPRKEKIVINNNFESKGEPISFDNYSISINKIDFNASKIEVKVTKN